MKKSILFAFLSCTALIGCSSSGNKALTMDEIRAMDYGVYPKDYETIIKQRLSKKDLSRLAGFDSPRKHLSISSISGTDEVEYVTSYLVCANLKGKTLLQRPFHIKNNEVVNPPHATFECTDQNDVVIYRKVLTSIHVEK